MRRIYIMIIIGIVAFSFTACSGDAEDSDVKEPLYVTNSGTTMERTTKEEVTMEIVETEIVQEMTTEQVNPREEILIAIDPGHQGPSVDMSAKEPNAPGSGVMKTKATSGTVGRFTNLPEYELNLTIALQLRDELEALGYQVILTREDNETAISNSERAILANEHNADVSIRIHANGSNDEGTNGALVLVGSDQNPYVGTLYEESYHLGEAILQAYCDNTGMQNLGIQTNDTMTGINWSTIPVVILEMGFMTNQRDDENMANPDYQVSMVEGIVNGVEDYFGFTSISGRSQKNDRNIQQLQQELTTFVAEQTANSGTVSVYVEDLETGLFAEVDNQSQKAASLIKLYIAGCIYEEQPSTENTQIKDVNHLIKQMLSASDNDATNELVTRLGEGDAQLGMYKVNQFCERHGLTDSHMGRLMLDFSSGKENYTSVRDSAAFLRSLYHGRLAGSEKMLAYLKEQQRTTKIPAGVPAEVETANKTGELEHTENDVAIVFMEDGAYVISVMTDDDLDTSVARSWIVELSDMVYNFFAQ